MSAISVAGFASCPFHQQALAAAQKLVDIGKFDAVEDLTKANRDLYQEWLRDEKPALEDDRAATHTSSPFVFSGDTFIGGCDDTLALLAESESGFAGPRANPVAGSADGPAVPFLSSALDVPVPDIVPLADEVIPSWKLLQMNRVEMDASTNLVAERALAVTLNGVPSNPARALAFQMQKRLDLMTLPKVEMVMPGVAVAVMSNVADYLAVTANPILKMYCKTVEVVGHGDALLTGQGSKL